MIPVAINCLQTICAKNDHDDAANLLAEQGLKNSSASMLLRTFSDEAKAASHHLACVIFTVLANVGQL